MQDFLLGLLPNYPSDSVPIWNISKENPSAAEKRGKNTAVNRISEEGRNHVKDFIDRFPKYESYYGRTHSKKKYLNPNVNLAKMYRMYRIETK